MHVDLSRRMLSPSGMQMKELTKPRGPMQEALEDLRTMAHEDSEMGWRRVGLEIVGLIWLLYRLCRRSLGLLRPYSTLEQYFYGEP